MLLLKSCLQTCMTYTIAECTVNKLPMMDRGTVRNAQSFTPKWICEISASSWFYYKEICYDARSHERKVRDSPCRWRFILKWSQHVFKCLTGPWDARWAHRSRGRCVWHLEQAAYGPHRIRGCEGDARRHCRAHQARECPLNCGPIHHHHSLIYCNTVIFIIRHFLESTEVATIENS